MERIEKTCGGLVMDKGHIFDIFGGRTDNGVVFKDADAFESGNGLCYVSEYALEDIEQQLYLLKDRYENATEGLEGLTENEYRIEREKIILKSGETRQTIIDQVNDAWKDDYLLTDKQAEYFAEDVFGLADWAYICTYLVENFELDDIIEEDAEKGGGIFNETQHSAVKQGLLPRELI